MPDWDDFEYEEPGRGREPDKYEVAARDSLEAFFEKNDSNVFFGNQLAVQNEDEFFHWITYRAVADLVEAGTLVTENRKLAIGSDIKLVWHRRLDFIFERDGKPYGIEVKNTLSYMNQKQFEVKIRLCEHLGVVPVFAARMLPKTWINELITKGGYAMIMKYQLYPWTHVDLARRVAKELSLPVDAPKALSEGTMNRFEKWHRKNL